ncbi:uncharacterized protein [Watersipora subatra]|uniref:uncharacterized protein n=1 Tax=Watersipora subatra TaxID=2589382 RepID=UPI00355B401A
MTDEGLFNMDQLDILLKRFKDSQRTLIGCMAAASNITGHMLPVDDITVRLHKAGAVALWDYAMAAPYVELNMNPVCQGDSQPFVYKDAMFISTHKFLGGPSSPGILVGKKNLFRNPVPADCGGGTVFFVRREHHTYLKEIETREEGGTPDIIGSIRAGMVLQLKRAVGVSNIAFRDRAYYKKAYDAWKGISELVILGSDSERLPVFSLLFKVGNKFLHHNYAAALLDDLFGIQSRGGCACAGPYALELLGIGETLAKRFEETLMEDNRLDRTHLRRVREHSDKEILRPGFVRLNFSYVMTEEQVDFIIEAVKMVATVGWKLLPRYLFNPTTGEWKVRHHEIFTDRRWLGYISYAEGEISYPDNTHDPKAAPGYKEVLDEATAVLTQCKSSSHGSDQRIMFGDTDLLWFVLPSEANDLLTGKLQLPLLKQPVFTPKRYHSHHQAGDTKDLKCISQAAAPSSDETRPESVKQACRKWRKVPKPLMTLMIKAINDFGMIKDGDKLLICLSGGKDSLSLLHALKQYQHVASSKGVTFSMAAATVDPGSTAYDPCPLIPYLAELGIPYFYEQQGIMQQAGSVEGGCDSICSYCSRMKRGRLYKCARQHGYNVLAMGQHLDDLAESFMMSTFHNGLLRTMKANYTVNEGDLRVIRPLVYVREKTLRDFAESQMLPVIAENCPACFEQPKERHRIKQLLASQEVMFPDLYKSLLSSLRPLMALNSSEMTLFKSISKPNFVTPE